MSTHHIVVVRLTLTAGVRSRTTQLLRMTGLLQLAGPEALREMQDAFIAGEGCRIHGTLPVPRVAGDFQLSINAQSLYMLRQVRCVIACKCWCFH